ncbi:MAG: dCMP deaminase family protein [Candidatus Moranbacteria bacterium]|nr:dCMP deaminase family protein [Candidatus Moranbacteria bacterium]
MREGYFGWDETFMQMCRVISNRSKDPTTQVGACIVNDKNIILGMGYNGFPRGCKDADLTWNRDGSLCETKYAYVVHAEMNAILNANGPTEGARLYCKMFPCNECAKVIIQAGIKEVIFESDEYRSNSNDVKVAAHKMLDLAGVVCKQYVPKNELIFKEN